MNIFEVKKVSCFESYLQTSARDLTLYLRCYSQRSQMLILAYILYGIGCMAVSIMSFSTPVFILVLGAVVLSGFLLRQQLKSTNTSYEVWKFAQNHLMIFKFKAPGNALRTSQLDTYLNQDSLTQQIHVSNVKKVHVEEYCNERGYQYICRLNVAQSIFQICLPDLEAYRLESEVNHWLTAQV